MAKYVYPAVFTHEAEGGYSITFPDLPDCATSAETLEEGIEMAADALCLMLYDMYSMFENCVSMFSSCVL